MDWIKWMGHAIGVSEGAEAQISEPVAKLRYLYKVYTETRGEEVNTPSHTHSHARSTVTAAERHVACSAACSRSHVTR
jgi:hypothetical protein